MCSGVVPQQPPTNESPYSVTKPDSASASSSGCSGYSAPLAPSTGRPGVGHHRHRDAGVVGQVAQVLAHLGGPGRAVQPDHVDAERLDRRQRRADLAAQQHGAGGFDGDVGDDRDMPAELGHRPARSQHRGLELQQVLAGLDEDRVGAALQHARAPPRRTRRGSPRTRCARASAAWCPGPSSRARTACDRRSPSRRRPGARSRSPSAKGHGSCRRCRSHRGWTGCSRTCWSRPRRRRPRSSCGGSAR